MSYIASNYNLTYINLLNFESTIKPLHTQKLGHITTFKLMMNCNQTMPSQFHNINIYKFNDKDTLLHDIYYYKYTLQKKKNNNIDNIETEPDSDKELYIVNKLNNNIKLLQVISDKENKYFLIEHID